MNGSVNTPTMKIVLLLQLFWLFSFVHSTPQVIGELNGVIILPCSLTPGEIEVIHWTFEGKNVHSYYEGKDVFDDQDPSYVGRTSLFLDQIKNGNASLQLKNLQKSDEQTYSCYLSTTKESKEFPVQLKVEDFGHSMEYTLDHDELKCYASHVYPSDIVTIEWYEDNHIKQQGISTSSLCISCNLKQHSYKCIIKHSVVQSTWTGVWQIEAPQQDSIKCPCSSCKIVTAESSVRLYLRKNTTEFPVTSLNRSSFVISNGYENRVHKLEEYSLRLNNLTVSDNGDYICEIRTSGEMLIAMTSINIAEQNEMFQRHHWALILSHGLFSFCIFFRIFFFIYKKNKTTMNQDSDSQTSS